MILDNSSKQSKKEKQLAFVGDSILNGIKERDLSGKHHVRVRAHPGAQWRFYGGVRGAIAPRNFIGPFIDPHFSKKVFWLLLLTY